VAFSGFYNKQAKNLSKVNRKYGFQKDTSHSIAEISKITGYQLSGLNIIYNKGVGA
jgi:hypothetical protein